MALKLLSLQAIVERQLIGHSPLLNSIRFGHRLRGKPPGVAKTLEQRLNDERIIDPEIEKKVDIGFPQLSLSKSEERKQRMSHEKSLRNNVDLERKARLHSLLVDLDDVKAEWLKASGQYHIRNVATHYGIYEHLFGKYAYFSPRIPLDITYKLSENEFLPVHYGNLLKPSDAQSQPNVSFDASINLCGTKSTNLWTLLMTNPDGHFEETEKECVHWFISNIPNGDVSKGETIVPYLQPFPPKGTGYHRHIFILYKQEEKIDFSAYSVKLNDLGGRTFSTFDFYKKYQDVVTPAGLSFFQSTWEKSLTDFYHNVLNIKEPRYEYDFPKAYIRDQTWFPLRQPFNLYLDKYRDEKEIAKEFVDRKLAKTHPFNGPKPPLRFPNAHSMKGMPSWLKTAQQKSRLGRGRILDYES